MPSHPSSSPYGEVRRQYNKWMIAPPSPTTAVEKAIAVTLLGENVFFLVTNSMKKRCKSKKKKQHVCILGATGTGPGHMRLLTFFSLRKNYYIDNVDFQLQLVHIGYIFDY
jgi:hypothetical protein